MNREWAELSTGPDCAVTSDRAPYDPRAHRTTAVKAKGAGAYAFVINDGDNCYGERAEIGEANPTRGAMSDTRLFREGQDDWVSFQVRLGADFPKDTSAWQVIAQWKQLPYSNMPEPYPMLALQVHNGRYWLDHRGSDTWSGPPAVLNRWATFTFHIHWSDDPSKGAVSIRGNPDGRGMRLLMPTRHLQTLARTTTASPSPRTRGSASTATLRSGGPPTCGTTATPSRRAASGPKRPPSEVVPPGDADRLRHLRRAAQLIRPAAAPAFRRAHGSVRACAPGRACGPRRVGTGRARA